MEQLDLRNHKPEAAARALHKWLKKNVGAVSAILMTPRQSEECGYGRVWRVMWEGGIYEWAVSLTCGGPINAHYTGYRDADGNYLEPEVLLLDAKHFVAEPYYSFDIGFYPTGGDA